MSDGERSWVASNRYWRKCGYFMLGLCVVGPLFLLGDELSAWQGFLVVSGSVIPLVLWMRRLAAWEESEALVIRSWFTTKRRLWRDIDQLCLIERNWGTSWVTAAVQCEGKVTYIKSMIAVSAAGVQRLSEELETLGQRRGLSVEQPSDTPFRRLDAGTRGFRPFD